MAEPKLSKAEIATARELLDALKRGDLVIKETAQADLDPAQAQAPTEPEPEPAPKMTRDEKDAHIRRAIGILVTHSNVIGNDDKQVILLALQDDEEEEDE